MPDCPCQGCTERYSGCHSECDRYKLFRVELDDYNRRLRKYHQGDTFSYEARDALREYMRKRDRRH